MRTLNQILDVFETIVAGHAQLNGFVFGQISDWDDEKQNPNLYPFLFVSPPSITQEKGGLTYTFDIAVAAPLQDDEQDRRDTWSDLANVLFDVVNHFRHQENSVSDSDEMRTPLDYSFTIEPFTERLDNILTGWEATLEITTDNDNNLCLAP